MHRSRRALATLGAAALVAGLVTLVPLPVQATAPAERDRTADQPRPLTLPEGHRAPMTHAVSLRAPKPKSPWPAKRRTALTVADTQVPAGTPAAQQLASATIVQDLVRGTISATVRLKAAPGEDPDQDSIVLVALGRRSADGRWCTSIRDAAVSWQAYGASAPGLARDGARMKLVHFPSAAAKKDQFDCAFAETWSYLEGDPSKRITLLDGRSTARLKPTYDKPKLQVKAPKKTAAKVNRWQKVKVKVRNTNPRVTAPGVAVKVKGKKVATKTKQIGKVEPGKSKSVKVKFRVRPGHRGKATIVVTSKTLTKRKAIRLH